MKLYHGTNQNFDHFSQDKARILNDYYGGGVAYFTDNFDIAKTYGRSMSKSKGGNIYVFEVSLSIRKLFDVDYVFTGAELKKFFRSRSEIEPFARGAGMLKYGVDKYQVIATLESGAVELSGDQVFKGLSAGMTNTAKARQKLMKLGYDTLRYNGGANMATAVRHNVYISFISQNILITEKYLFDPFDKKFKEA